MNKFKLSIFIIMVLVSACQKNESTTTGNPVVSLKISSSSQPSTIAKNLFEKFLKYIVPSAIALPPPSSMSDAFNNTVTLNTAFISVESIEFEATSTSNSEETDGDEVEFHGPYHVDLFAVQPESLGKAQVSLRSIKRIKMKLAKVEDDAQGAPLGMIGHSVLISGQVSGNNFTFKSDDEVEFEVGGENALDLGRSSDLLLTIRMADLIRQIDLSAISNATEISSSNRVSASSPCPLIDSSASDLYTCFRKGIDQQADFGKDDGDGELDEHEESVKD